MLPRLSLLLACLASLINAEYYLETPANVTAGAYTHVLANLSGDGQAHGTDYGGYNFLHYKITLAASIGCDSSSSSGSKDIDSCQTMAPICTLIPCLNVNITAFNVSIPASVGPSGRFYSLSYQFFNDSNANPRILDPSSLGYSNGWNDFTLANGTGEWSSFETDSLDGMWDYPREVPCKAYDCARQCAVKLDLVNREPRVYQKYSDMEACLDDCEVDVSLPTGCLAKNTWDPEIGDLGSFEPVVAATTTSRFADRFPSATAAASATVSSRSHANAVAVGYRESVAGLLLLSFSFLLK